MEMHNF